MDKQLLQALNNLSYSLEQISEALNKKKESATATGSALQSGDISKQVQEINNGIKQIQADTKKISEQQNTIVAMQQDILNLQRQNNNNQLSIFDMEGQRGQKKKMITDGIGVILLIAGGVLALGASFKILGDINWVSVLSLSIALPLIAHSFSKISQLGLTPKDMFMMIGVTVAMATAISLSSYILSTVQPIGYFQALTSIFIAGIFGAAAFGISKIIKSLSGISLSDAFKVSSFLPIILIAVSASIAASSWILGKVQPIGFFQALTAIMIAGVFAVISFGLPKLINSFKGISSSDAAKAAIIMPIVLLGISGAITLSSMILSKVQPIGFFQALTAIMIAGVFAVISFGIGKLIKSFNGISPATAATTALSMPIILIALSGAITLSSIILSGVKPIGFFQALTAIMIAGVFVIMSYAIAPLVRSVKGISYGDILKGTLIMIAMTGGILASSYLINMMPIVGIGKMLSFLGIGLVIGATSIVMGIAFRVLSKINPADALKGSLVMVIMATTIMLSSLILSVGDYKKYPNLSWTLGVGVSILGFALSAVALGAIMLTGVGAVAMLAGIAAIMAVAASIVAVDGILSMGSYKKYPSLGWALGVGGMIVAFSTAVMMLGVFNTVGGVAETLSFGLIENPIDAGVSAVLKIATLIPTTDAIISAGSYTKYPSLGWALGVGGIMVAFSTGVMILGTIGSVASFVFDAGISAIKSIASCIVDTSHILSKGSYDSGPTEKWAHGIALALGAFSSVYQMLALNNILKIFGAGVSVNDYVSAIKTISTGIIDAANHFENNKSSFIDGPSVKWADGMSKALSAFSPIYQMLSDNSGWFKSGVSTDQYVSAIKTISTGIIDAANHFENNKSSFVNGPSVDWADGVGKAIAAFSPVYQILAANSGWFKSGVSVDDMRGAIITISTGIVDSAKYFSKNNAAFDISRVPKKEWAEGVGGSISAFAPVFQYLSENSGWFGSDIEDLNSAIISICKSLVKSSHLISTGNYSTVIPQNFVNNLSSNIKTYLSMMNDVSEFDFDDEVNNSILKIIQNILLSDKYLSSGTFQKYPSSQWIDGMTYTLIQTSKIVEIPSDLDFNRVNNLLSTISYIDKSFQSGSYISFPSKQWIDGISLSLIGIGWTSKYIDDNFDTPSVLFNMLSTINVIDSQLKGDGYQKYPSQDWINGVSASLIGIGWTSKYIDDNFDAPSILFNMLSTINVIDSQLKDGFYQKYPSKQWVDGVSASLMGIGWTSKYIDDNFDAPSVLFNILSTINNIDNTFKYGLYQKYPSQTWINGVSASLMGIGWTSKYIDDNFSTSSVEDGLIKMEMIAQSIQRISQYLSMGNYLKFPSSEWSMGAPQSIKSFMQIDPDDLVEYSNEDINLLSKMVDVIKYIDSKFKSGDFTKYPSVEWVNGTIMAIEKFRDILSALRFESIGDKIFSFIGLSQNPLMEAVSNISLLAKSFESLGQSVGTFTKSLGEIDEDKLMAIRALSNNVVLLSLMDPDQFDKMMDKLESRSGVFSELLKDLNKNRVESNNSSINISKQSDDKNDLQHLYDRVDKMTAILSDIASVVGTRGTLNTYLSSIKNDVVIGGPNMGGFNR